jgi:hypothetical protein
LESARCPPEGGRYTNQNRVSHGLESLCQSRYSKIKRRKFMQQSSTTMHDGNPSHAVTLTASFTIDAQDPNDHQTAAALASAFNGRKSSAVISITTPDPATVKIQVTI